MSFRLISIATLVSLMTVSALADLVVHWPLDEGSGEVVTDKTGNGRAGAFTGNPQWVEGLYGSAFGFSGTSDYVTHTLPAALNYDDFTVVLWVRAGVLGQPNWSALFSSYTSVDSGFQFDTTGTLPDSYRMRPLTTALLFGPVSLEWVHLAVVAEGTDLQLYYNGNLAVTGSGSINNLLFNKFTLGTSRNNVNLFNGAVDDFRFYDQALSEADLMAAMADSGHPPELSINPYPLDGAADVSRDAGLEWTSGDFADRHSVYLGTDPNTLSLAGSALESSFDTRAANL
jgi:hypothetical protein